MNYGTPNHTNQYAVCFFLSSFTHTQQNIFEPFLQAHQVINELSQNNHRARRKKSECVCKPSFDTKFSPYTESLGKVSRSHNVLYINFFFVHMKHFERRQMCLLSLALNWHYKWHFHGMIRNLHENWFFCLIKMALFWRIQRKTGYIFLHLTCFMLSMKLDHLWNNRPEHWASQSILP